ncbi:hypothetical protein BDN71DRAFT_1505490 [Pleurotus eryngii]|uniref:Beta-lactamase-related domain-containing protein n=1 Tax=Pleurotus eryngii TaxID=5323 RepID=A0A9P6A0H7_PLEER|nr:hypothetical protein BDN71DRAFT_1505490 [Pleurotus eryngii]
MSTVLLQFVALCSCFVSPFANVLPHQPASSPILNAEIDAFINDLLTDWNSPGGVSVAVVRKTRNNTWNVETKGYGVAKADGTNVTAQTLSDIGSNSKLFDILATGLLIANTSLDPRISWNTKIKSIIPKWAVALAYLGTTSWRLWRTMYSMRRATSPIFNALSFDGSFQIRRFRFLRPSTEFRETLQYNNNMSDIFEPPGLNSTTYSFGVANATGNLADGFFKQQTNLSASPFEVGIPRAVPFWARMGGEDGHLDSGAGGVISNAASWLQTLLSGGRNAATDEAVIPPEAINMVSSGVTVFESSPQHPFLSAVVYGGGQAQIAYRGHGVGTSMAAAFQVSHDGMPPQPPSPYSVCTIMIQLIHITAISLAIKYRISDGALGLTPIDSKTINIRYFAATIQRPKNATLPPNGVECLAGLYEDPAYGRVELCLASANATTVNISDTCRALTSYIIVVLPGVVDPTIPTLLAKWDRPFGAYTDNGTLWFGLLGAWGAGASVPGPTGDTTRERSEIWFTNV